VKELFQFPTNPSKAT